MPLGKGEQTMEHLSSNPIIMLIFTEHSVCQALCSVYIISLKLCNNPVRLELLFFLFYTRGNRLSVIKKFATSKW